MIAEDENNPKEMWRTLKFLDMSSKRSRRSKIFFKRE